MIKIREKIFYKNKKGMIICLLDRFGEISYLLFDAQKGYVKTLIIPFKVSDYL